jgi:hypothetical protein
VCAWGEAWLFDPQLRTLLPHGAGINAIQRAVSLVPSGLPEAATIRRLFGPDLEREHLSNLPRAPMTRLQRALVDFLADPANALTARGGFLHSRELALLEAQG